MITKDYIRQWSHQAKRDGILKTKLMMMYCDILMMGMLGNILIVYMQAYLMWTINDFPAYVMFSGCGTKGKLACAYCMEDIKAFTLKHGGKSSWFDCHRQFLPTNHPFKRIQRRFLKNKVEMDNPPVLNGNKLWEILCDFPKVAYGPPYSSLLFSLDPKKSQKYLHKLIL